MADDHHDIELQSGSALGPYDLLAPIGEGGMARVWAARVRGKADVVALKMLLPELAEDGLCQHLARLHPAAGDGPLPRRRAVSTADEEEPLVIEMPKG